MTDQWTGQAFLAPDTAPLAMRLAVCRRRMAEVRHWAERDGARITGWTVVHGMFDQTELLRARGVRR